MDNDDFKHGRKLFEDFLREQQPAYELMKQQFPGEEIDLYQDRLTDLIALVRVLMYYKITPERLDNLLKLDKSSPGFMLLNEKENDLSVYARAVANLDILLYGQGQLNTLRLGKPVDRDGNPIPWITYPALEFLLQFDFSDCSVFEFGSGNSTLFWAARAQDVISVDTNREWHESLSNVKPDNVRLFHKETVEEFADVILESGASFDVIVVDSVKFRFDSTVNAVKRLNPGGFIILDNSDWYPNSCQILRQSGFTQIDFHGFGPVNGYTWTTSVFFRDRIEIKRKEAALHPVGGLMVYPDDDWRLRHDLAPDIEPSAPLHGLKLIIKGKELEKFSLIQDSGLSAGELKTILDFYADCRRYAALFPETAEPFPLPTKNPFRALLDDIIKAANINTLDAIADIADGIRPYYAQEGEDLILSRFFDGKNHGFYVDVGAYHPKRFSNTYLFYKLGWSGINIEPALGAKELFDGLRPRDTNLDCAVSDIEEERDFYVFEEPALNTFSRKLAEEYRNAGSKMIGAKRISTRRLSGILTEHAGCNRIDFMTIDVEGHELPVLRSNDWQRFRPGVLLIEILNFDINKPDASPAHNYIVKQGYELMAKTFNTVFYRDITG